MNIFVKIADFHKEYAYNDIHYMAELICSKDMICAEVRMCFAHPLKHILC